MKRSINKAVVILMTAALLFSSLVNTGCSSSKKDIKEIKEVTQGFVDAYGAGDTYAVAEYVNGSFPFKAASNKCLICAASKTKIVKFNSVEVDKDSLTAKAEVVLSVVNAGGLASALNIKVHSMDEYMSIIESFNEMHEETISLNYTYDKYDECWALKNESANDYERRFIDTSLMTVTTVMNIYEGFANGEFSDGLYEGYYLDCFSLTDSISAYYGDVATCEAIYKYATAYFKTILNHGITVGATSDYNRVTVTGFAPYTDQIIDYFTDEDYIVDAYKIYYKALTWEYDYDDMWNQKWIDTHLDMAAKIPDMDIDNYYVELTIDTESADPRIDIIEDIYPVTKTHVYDTLMLSDQNFSYGETAVEELYNDGEITKSQHDGFMVAIKRDRDPHRDTRYDFLITDHDVNWEGTENHKNLSGTVIEYIFDESHGELFYGMSRELYNGIRLYYSKAPGWNETSGFCIDEDGITAMLLFERSFDAGTVFEYEWNYNDETILESGTYTVAEDGKKVFEFTIKDAEVTDDNELAFYLWEEGKEHLIGYVKLVKTEI
ncbi:MAG: hypothetical protein IKH20_01330 [Clostridiales bacterium]|nr:hypothetical protein [Clostridiales bacterium]